MDDKTSIIMLCGSENYLKFMQEKRNFENKNQIVTLCFISIEYNYFAQQTWRFCETLFMEMR